ncbi:hypothetical protein MTO96_040094, partial [Rhipicephalus appendiculatus]
MSTWGEEATLYFLSLVEYYPELWHPSTVDYSDSQKKQKLWSRIAEDMTALYPGCGPHNA